MLFPTSLAIAYSALLFAGAHAWMIFYGLGGQGWLAHLSYLVQQVVVLSLYALVDARLRSASVRFLLASSAALYIAFIQLDALLIEVIGLSSYRALIMFAAGGPSTLAEIGLRPTRLLLLVFVVGVMCGAGGIAHRMLDRWRVTLTMKQTMLTSTIAVVILPLAFTSEQVLSRDDDRYVYRSIELPGYFQLYDTATRSHDVALESPAETVSRHAYLSALGPARNERHVLFVLLESVRADAINPKISPTLSLLAQSSLNFTNAYAEAIFTPLSWNVLLLDRPPHMFMWPRTMLAPRSPGSWPLNVLRHAGYQIWVSSSTDLEYGHFLPFMLGERELVDRLNVIRGSELERWERDDRATAELVDWIDSAPLDKPTFMLLQLDSTHWTYQFPPHEAIVEPYSAPLTMPVPLTTEEEFRLLHNRYQNCVHHVDKKVAEVLAALRRRGVEGETAVVVVADHGEGFALGIQGHGVLCEATTRIPLMLRLPGFPAQQIDELVSFRNLFPTLFHYLQIESFDESLMLGRSVLPPHQGESEILMFSPDGRRADLRLADGRRIQFNVLMRESHASFTPVGKIDGALPWREMIERRMSFKARAGAQDQQPTVSAVRGEKAPSG